MDTDMHRLLVANPLRESTLRAVIETVQLPSGSHGLDAGCGIGLQCLLLAEKEFRRLCQPDSPDFILNHSDYYAFFTHTLFWGSVCEK